MYEKSSRYGVVRRLGTALLRFMQQIEAVYEHIAASTRMHPTDFRTICLLADAKTPLSPKDIGHALGLTSGAVSALILRLEGHGLISRQPNPTDRRGVLISLNEETAAPALRDYHALHAHYMQVTEEFTAAELEVVARYMENIRQVTTGHLMLAGAEPPKASK
ncbi:MarR family winged helix-turn-helix transcriptional regulator [Pseudodonghicola flavimaris]|uniref:MarR family transcriptional regulator n=1 Tax=Pseudodonghicola flavimaris TaxID=3050036 RepID=A0ABT7F6F2_9RHOB|nr:MarR family transcriptional regulator [Pseudodonghicola flavimaris]MDK3020193.1 MarR family transcriptional regulator [Pseudodonghicola flavimaris]